MTKLDTLKKQAADLEAKLEESTEQLKEMKAEIERLENGWEMKCPYKNKDAYWFIHNNVVEWEYWEDTKLDKERFEAGNTFPTEETAELEAKRRNLLTRFRAFRDESNNGWNPNFSNHTEKYYLFYSTMEDCIKVDWMVLGCSFNNFGYFKNRKDAERAVELFGDEIKELYVDCDCEEKEW